MEFQSLESKLRAMAEQCERLASLLGAEREAMKAWKLRQLEQLAEDKELLLAAIQEADRELKDEFEQICRRLGCTAGQLLARPDASRVRELKERVAAAGAVVRREGELNRQAAEHVVGFLRKLQGDSAEARPLSYAPKLGAYARSMGYQFG